MGRMTAVTIGSAFLAFGGLLATTAFAASLRADLLFAGMQGPGEKYGTLSLSDHLGGSRVKAELHGLPEGAYAVEVHEGTSCQLDYESHPGPEGASPLMPQPAGAAGPKVADGGVITVSAKGTSREVIYVPRLKDVGHLHGHAVILRGERLLCGVLE